MEEGNMAEENYTDLGPAVSPQAQGMAEQTKGPKVGRPAAGQRQNVRRSGRRETTADGTQSQGVSGREVLEDAKERLRTLKQDTDDYVRQNPTKAVFTALGIGFVLGLMRRR